MSSVKRIKVDGELTIMPDGSWGASFVPIHGARGASGSSAGAAADNLVHVVNNPDSKALWVQARDGTIACDAERWETQLCEQKKA